MRKLKKYILLLAMFAMLAGMQMMKPVDMEAGMKQLYYDLAGDPMPEAMDMLLKITDEGHLLYGSDFPYVPAKALLGKKAALDNELANRQWLAKILMSTIFSQHILPMKKE